MHRLPLFAALAALALPTTVVADPAVSIRAAAPQPVAAQPAVALAQDAVHGLTPHEVRAWLLEKGASVEEPQTVQGQTLLRVNDGSANWLIFFYGCDATGRCLDIQFAASVSAGGLSLERINAWNREQRFIKAYLQPGTDAAPPTAVLQYDLLFQPGLGVEQMNDPTVVWLEMLAQFVESLIPSAT